MGGDGEGEGNLVGEGCEVYRLGRGRVEGTIEVVGF